MLSVVLRTVFIFIFVAAVMRLTGKRQVGELEVSELITTLLLSELAAEPITDFSTPLLWSVIPILILLSAEVIMSFAAAHSPKLKRMIVGSPNLLFRDGRIIQSEMSRTRIGADELVSELRNRQISSFDEVETVILETNGKLSVLLKESEKPPSRTELSVKVPDTAEYPVIIKGKTVKFAICAAGKTEKQVLKAAGNTAVEDIFLMLMTRSGKVRIIKEEKK